MQSLEDGDTLLELVGDKAQEVKVCIVDGTVADCNTGGDTLRTGLQLVKVQSLLAGLLNLAGNGEYYIIDAVRPDLIADDTCEDTQVSRELQAFDLGVDELMDGERHCTGGIDVGGGVLVITGGHGVLKDSGGVFTLLDAVHHHLTEELILGLLSLELGHLTLIEQSLDLYVQAVILADEGIILGCLLLSELALLLVCELFHLVELDQNLVMTLLDFCFCSFFHCKTF